jgi:hypothetical protein
VSSTFAEGITRAGGDSCRKDYTKAGTPCEKNTDRWQKDTGQRERVCKLSVNTKKVFVVLWFCGFTGFGFGSFTSITGTQVMFGVRLLLTVTASI